MSLTALLPAVRNVHRLSNVRIVGCIPAVARTPMASSSSTSHIQPFLPPAMNHARTYGIESRTHFKSDSRGAHPLHANAVAGDRADDSKSNEDYLLPHPIWSPDELQTIEITHRPPKDNLDRAAFYSVQTMRFGFDVFSGYYFGKMDEIKWLRRFIFLETVAGVPGMVGAMGRHLLSLRTMQRDHGWIHTLLEEAENERMHLLTWLELRQPSKMFRAMVVIAQGVFTNTFFLAYMISPKFCHRFVGYLEEEAVKTYTKALKQCDDGELPMWKSSPAMPIAKKYWNLDDDAQIRDVIAAVRADEAHHRDVNHELSTIYGKPNPFGPGA